MFDSLLVVRRDLGPFDNSHNMPKTITFYTSYVFIQSLYNDSFLTSDKKNAYVVKQKIFFAAYRRLWNFVFGRLQKK